MENELLPFFEDPPTTNFNSNLTEKKSSFCKFLIWGCINLSGLLIVEICKIKIYVKNKLNWLVYFTDKKGDYFQLIKVYNPKQPIDYTKMAYLIVLAFFLANLESRITKNRKIYLISFVSIPVFAFLGRLKIFNAFTLTRYTFSHLDSWSIMAIVLLLTLVVLLLLYNFRLASKEKELYAYSGSIFIVILFYVSVYILFVTEDIIMKYHIHHWWVGYHLALICRYDSFITNWIFMIAYSVFLEGFGLQSMEPIIENSKIEN